MFKLSEKLFVGLAGAAVGAAAGAGAAKVLPGKHDTKVLITPKDFHIPVLNTIFRKPLLLVLQSDSPLVDIRKNKMKNRKRTKNKFLPFFDL